MREIALLVAWAVAVALPFVAAGLWGKRAATTRRPWIVHGSALPVLLVVGGLDIEAFAWVSDQADLNPTGFAVLIAPIKAAAMLAVAGYYLALLTSRGRRRP